MTPDLLMKHFDRISEAPDAIPRLRQFILDLGVRGKLVEQCPQDEPASELLKRIASEKSQLVREGEIASSKPLSQPRADQLPFDLKPGWQPARFSQILVELQTGPFGSSLHQSDYEKNGTPVINPASIKNGRLVPVPGMAVGPQTIARLATFKLRENDIVMARRGEMGRCAIVGSNERGWLCGTGSLILRLPKCVFQPFIVLLIGSPLVREYLNGSAVGATMQNLNQGILLNLVIALPPLAEQRRIVAKVGELMTLADQLEAARAEQNRRRDSLVAAANHHLMNGDGRKGLQVAARFYFNNLPRLTATNGHIDTFRKTILNLAIKGSLILQDSGDCPASELLERIQASKPLPPQVHKIREESSPNPLEGAGFPFGLPSNWQWVSLDAILGSSFYGPRFGTEEYSQTGVPTIRTTDMTIDGRIELRDPPMVSVPADRLEAFKCQKGDLLITRTGSIGVMAVFKGDYLAIPSAYLIRLRFTSGILVDYIHTVLRSPYGQSSLGLNTTKVAQPNINAKNLRSILIPLPPRAEQSRIVARVEELMKLCDELEVRITSDAEISHRLLEGLLSEALGINEVFDGRGFGVDRKTNNLCPEEGELHERTV